MKHLIIVLSTCLLTSVVAAQTNEAILVKQAFNKYKSAILNDKAEEALDAVDSRTIKYYTDILDAVKTADSTKIESMSLIDKITVLSIRSRANKEEILAMKGPDLFLYSIKNGMVGKNGVMNNSVGDIIINKDFAKGLLLVNGKKTPLYFHFYKEQRKWKLDITALFPVSNMSLQQMIKQSGKSENEYLLLLLQTLTGKKLGHEIWEPAG